MIAAVATVLLMLAIIGSHAPDRPVARGNPPWPAPGAGKMIAGVKAAGLSLLSAPGHVIRYATHLDVLVGRMPVTVPAGVGIDYRPHLIAPLYTSDTSGTIHVAADSGDGRYTLGQFFSEWQVPLTPGRIGAPLTVYVDGTEVPGDPASLVLAPHQEIVVSYGAIDPAGVPAKYAFPPGT